MRCCVQLARPAELESIKDQMVNLKRLCRIRTVKAIKQVIRRVSSAAADRWLMRAPAGDVQVAVGIAWWEDAGA